MGEIVARGVLPTVYEAFFWKFKRSGLPGNLMVSISVAACFILGQFLL